MIALFIYAGLKLDTLVNRENPNVSTFIEEFALGSDDKVNLKNVGMRFAWTFEGYSDKELKNDPRYVKQLVRMSGRTAGKSEEIILSFHVCTEEDLKYFAPPTADAGRVLNSIMADPKRALFCFDWDKLADTIEIWGVSSYDDFRYVDIELVPCQYNHTFAGWRDDVIPEECTWDR